LSDLRLAWETPAAWADVALEDPLALLSDHAHCELGAAASAQKLIARNSGRRLLVERCAALAVEELGHFRRVHALLRAQGGTLAPPIPNPYVAGLRRAAETSRAPGAPPLVDALLVAALIERRSLERFELLAAAAPEPLAELWRELGPSEAGHAHLFVALAEGVAGEEAARARLDALARQEGALVAALPGGSRIHSGGAA
jgi:tRNA-(ms[2]io[6]A)-hydroxylase